MEPFHSPTSNQAVSIIEARPTKFTTIKTKLRRDSNGLIANPDKYLEGQTKGR